MGRATLPEMKTYTNALAVMDGRVTRRIGYATELEQMEDGITLLHHGSPIVWWSCDGSRIEFTTCGFDTLTTASRIDQVTRLHGVRVAIRNGATVWRREDEPERAYRPMGMRTICITREGDVTDVFGNELA